MAITPIPRKNPSSTDQNIEALPADRGAGGVTPLVQSILNVCVPGITVAHTTFNCTTSTGSTTLVATNVKRCTLIIRNEGSQKVYLGCGGAATNTKLPLYPSESFTDSWSTLAWYSLASSGSCTIHITEVSLP